jgi:predicted NAD/FAD-binding protein
MLQTCDCSSHPQGQHSDLKDSNTLATHTTCQHRKISLTLDMHKIQQIPDHGDSEGTGRILLSMNPSKRPSSVEYETEYMQPLFTSESVQASWQLRSINGVSGISFAGAWQGYGFHEDGFVSGMNVARTLVGTDETKRMIPSLVPTASAMRPANTRIWSTRGLIRLAIELIQTFLN